MFQRRKIPLNTRPKCLCHGRQQILPEKRSMAKVENKVVYKSKGFPMQKLGILVVCWSCLHQRKKILSENHVVIVLQVSIKLERMCKHMGSRKALWLKPRYFMSFAARLPSQDISNYYKYRASGKTLQFFTVSSIFILPKSRNSMFKL